MTANAREHLKAFGTSAHLLPSDQDIVDDSAATAIAPYLAIIDQNASNSYSNATTEHAKTAFAAYATSYIQQIYQTHQTQDQNIFKIPRTTTDLQQQDREKIRRAYWDARRKTYLNNTVYAVIGGLFLIAPMLIMTLHPTTLTSLLTTSLFIFNVAAILAFVWQSAEPKDIVGATAAYAAVLVVFVGTGSGNSATSPTAPQNDWGITNGQVAGTVVGALAAAGFVLYVFVWGLSLFAPGRRLGTFWSEHVFPHTSGKGKENV
jgi:hypothetical protein